MPVEFALTAGSLGDIQGVITLLCKLGIALYDANDASTDYRDLKKEMCAFYGTLLEVKKVQDSISSESSVDSLASEIAECQTDLLDFLKKYHMQSRWDKIKWVFWGNSAAASLRETLMRHRQTIQTRLTTTIFLHDRSQWNARDITIKDMHSIIRQGVETMYLVDVYGNRNEIGLEHCQTFKMFNEFVKYYFRHQRPPGNICVERDAYQLLRADGTSVINHSNWNIPRGAVIEMSAIVRWEAPINQGNARCPRCRSSNKSRSKGRWFECNRCDALFRVKECGEDDSEIVTSGFQSDSVRGKPKEKLEILGASERKEIGQLRRVLIVPEPWWDSWDWLWDKDFPMKLPASKQ